MTWFNAWFRYSAVITLALLLFVLPVSAAIPWNASAGGCWTYTDSTYTWYMWNASGIKSWTIPAGVTQMSAFVVGGGGGGGGAQTGNSGAGGGGAGQALNYGPFAVTAGTVVNVTVGAGGDGGAHAGGAADAGTRGGYSNFSVYGAYYGGGGGGGTQMNGLAGASGGGGRNGGTGGARFSAATGYAGGAGVSAGQYPGGGGGGMGSVGGDAPGSGLSGGNGGTGTSFVVGGQTIWFSGGGGGAIDSGTAGTGGSGVGGNGGSGATLPTAGADGTGSGGGGADSVANANGARGGNGTIIAYYLKSSNPLDVSFTKNATIGNAPLTVKFNSTISSVDTILTSVWVYSLSGTGTTFSTSKNVTYTFNGAGTYLVNFTATTAGNSTTTASQQIIVNGFDAPIANFTINPSTGTPGALIQFNDTSTVPSTNGLVYNWSFGTGSIEANPFSDTIGSVAHVYNYGGVYNINLTVSNYNGTSYMYVPAGVTISTEQRMTNWYSPHQVRFRVLDANDNVIIGAKVNATAYESSLPGGFSGAQQVLVEMYGINSISAAQMVSSAVQMEGYTGDDGAISLTMHSNLKYLVYVVDSSGNSFTKTLYPQMEQYLIRVTTAGAYTPPQDATNILSTQGNATLTFSEPDIYNCTLGVDYMDITSRTTSLTFTAVLLNNNTVMNTQTTAVTGTQHILLNYTVPNTRGQQWKWYYNATVV